MKYIINRSASIALVHDRLYKGRDLRKTSLHEYIFDLVKNIKKTLVSDDTIICF
ncbi:MAG: hypothetical protein KKC64_04405 [Spirochaetes bacterium]|nr:hypothetical protein [Spirochaetota bacterium]